jgi:hypothetical protein
VLDALTPDIIQQDVGDIDLTHMNNTHGDNPDQNEGGHIGAELQILGQEAHRKKPHSGPKEHLEEAEDIALGDDQILKYEGQDLRPLTSQTQ